MPEVLSQSQIDALLNSISSGEEVVSEEEEGANVKVYDFYSPKKFTKEQLRTIDSLHENMGRVLSSYFSGILRVFCDISVLQVEEQRYYEYNNALPDTALIGLVDMKPANINLPDATLMLDMSNNLAFFLIDRLLGGAGGSTSTLQRDFTDIELAIMNDIYLKITEFLLDAWRDHLDVSGELSSLETNPRLIQVYAPEDIVVIAVLAVKLRDMEGTLSVCIPAMGLEAYLGEFTSKYARISHKMSNERLDNMRKDLIQEQLNDSELTVKAVFDQTSIDVADALRLRPNDIIPLTKPLNGVVQVEVDDAPWFTAQLGECRNRKAIKIINLLEDAGELTGS